MNSYVSIYIPRMSTVWTEYGVKIVMERMKVGTVSYVDFTPIHKKPGFGEDIDSVMSAFVHFEDPLFGMDGKYHCMSGFPLNEFWTAIENGKSYKIQACPEEYWICLKNKNPIKRTLMNIHQVVENGRYLENLVTSQAEEIKNLKETVDNLRQTVYQLLGGLYCQRTQGGVLNIHVKNIGCSDNGRVLENDTHPFGIWPTTRQGDQNSKRIEKIEETLRNITNFDLDCFNDEHNETKSQNSTSSTISFERIKNSFDLCGNE